MIQNYSELLKQVSTHFFVTIESEKQRLSMMNYAQAYDQIFHEIGEAIDFILNEKLPGYCALLLRLCQEREELFTGEPEAYDCITNNGSSGQVNAAHCVYHRLYEQLKSDLEQQFTQWYEHL